MNKKRNSGDQKKIDSYFIYGKHPVFSALKNEKRKIYKIYCSNKIFYENEKLLKNYNINITKDLSSISNIENHQGIIAEVSSIWSNNLSNLIHKWKNEEKIRIAILNQVVDPQNIGTIIRNAVAFNIDTLVMSHHNSPNENGTIAKVACGSMENIEVIKVTNIRNTIEILKKNDFWIAGFDANGTTNMENIKSIEKLVIILGAEGKGISKMLQDECDFLVSIPISRNIESINVASTSAIAFYMLQ